MDRGLWLLTDSVPQSGDASPHTHTHTHTHTHSWFLEGRDYVLFCFSLLAWHLVQGTVRFRFNRYTLSIYTLPGTVLGILYGLSHRILKMVCKMQIFVKYKFLAKVKFESRI